MTERPAKSAERREDETMPARMRERLAVLLAAAIAKDIRQQLERERRRGAS